MQELKPCPFCGTPNTNLYFVNVDAPHGYDTVGIFCNSCKQTVILEENELQNPSSSRRVRRPTMIKCTGINCPMQVGAVNPADCKAAESCQYATRPVTRADCVRAMTDEELAMFLAGLADCYECPAEEPCRNVHDNSGCAGGMLAYLKSEVGKDNEP